MKKRLKRLWSKPDWHNLKTVKPISRSFGFERGTPIDRIYIEDFLGKQKNHITGNTLEIAEDYYSKKFGVNVQKHEILHATADNTNATIIGDLADINTLPKDRIDCFICTQTLNFIYDFKKAIQGGRHLLKKNGVMLVTVAGISQISRYDMDRWGDFWRFNTLSMLTAFEEVFGKGQVEVDFYGNVLAATALLQGISAEELSQEELFFKDDDYQVTIVIKATK